MRIRVRTPDYQHGSVKSKNTPIRIRTKPERPRTLFSSVTNGSGSGRPNRMQIRIPTTLARSMRIRVWTPDRMRKNSNKNPEKTIATCGTEAINLKILGKDPDKKQWRSWPCSPLWLGCRHRRAWARGVWSRPAAQSPRRRTSPARTPLCCCPCGWRQVSALRFNFLLFFFETKAFAEQGIY